MLQWQASIFMNEHKRTGKIYKNTKGTRCESEDKYKRTEKTRN